MVCIRSRKSCDSSLNKAEFASVEQLQSGSHWSMHVILNDLQPAQAVFYRGFFSSRVLLLSISMRMLWQDTSSEVTFIQRNSVPFGTILSFQIPLLQRLQPSFTVATTMMIGMQGKEFVLTEERQVYKGLGSVNFCRIQDSPRFCMVLFCQT